MDSGYGSGSLGRKPSEDFSRHRPSDDEFPPSRRSDDAYGRSGLGDDTPNIYGARRKPSQDMRVAAAANAASARVGASVDFGRRPSASASIRSDSSGTTNAQSATATSGMVIPNKSTIAEEDIEVPFGRELRDSSITTIDDRDRSQEGGREVDGDVATDGENDSPMVGLSGLSARLRFQGDLDDDGVRSGEDYFDKVSIGRASVTSDRSAGGHPGLGSRMLGGRTSVGGDEHERLRREYEFKIATMQNRITTLERDLTNAEQQEGDLRESQQRIHLLEDEIDGFRKVGHQFRLQVVILISVQRAEEQAIAMRALQKELDETRELRTREKERESVRIQGDAEELRILREQCERLEQENRSSSVQVRRILVGLSVADREKG